MLLGGRQRTRWSSQPKTGGLFSLSLPSLAPSAHNSPSIHNMSVCLDGPQARSPTDLNFRLHSPSSACRSQHSECGVLWATTVLLLRPLFPSLPILSDPAIIPHFHRARVDISAKMAASEGKGRNAHARPLQLKVTHRRNEHSSCPVCLQS